MAASAPPRLCLVCSTPNVAMHLGLDACRACASFFKRSQLRGQGYPCRAGNHQCAIIKGVGSMCRGCRYDKCAAIGMAYYGPMRTNKLAVASSIDGPSSFLANRGDSLLNRIARAHAACVAQQRERELALVKRHSLERLPHPTEEVYLTTYEFTLAAFDASIASSWQCLLSVFPSLRGLSYNDQRYFVRLCMPQFGALDSFDRTKRIWGGFTNKYFMCSVLACSDKHHPDPWMGPHAEGPMRGELLESIRAFDHDHRTLVLPSFEKAGICEREKHALLALMLCESGEGTEFADRFQPFIEQVRRQIHEELHRFYTEEMGLAEYSTRLGNLMTICHTFREGYVLYQEFLRMQVTVFDLYVTETLLREVIL